MDSLDGAPTAHNYQRDGKPWSGFPSDVALAMLGHMQAGVTLSRAVRAGRDATAEADALDEQTRAIYYALRGA